MQKRWAGLRDFSLIIQRVGVWIEKSLPGDVLVLVADTSVLHSAFPLLSSSRRPPLVLPLFGHHLQSTFSALLPLPPQPLNILDSLSVFLNVWSLLEKLLYFTFFAFSLLLLRAPCPFLTNKMNVDRFWFN